MVSDTTATLACAVRSDGVKPRPLTKSMPSTSKYSGDTAVRPTGNLLGVATTLRAGLEDAATADTSGCATIDCSSAARRGSLSLETLTMSLIRMGGSSVAAARDPRRKMAAQISKSADAPTCTAIRACRARRG